MSQETICLDFDGVLHSYTSKWAGATTIPDPPTPGAQAFCQALLDKGFSVVILSTRASYKGGPAAMQDWLRLHGFPKEVQVAEGEKPPAAIYVDDRGYRFDGDFDKCAAFIGMPRHTPKPWNKESK